MHSSLATLVLSRQRRFEPQISGSLRRLLLSARIVGGQLEVRVVMPALRLIADLSRFSAVFAIALGCAVLLPLPARANGGAPRKEVLLLHSYHQGYRWTDGVTAGVQGALKRRKDIRLHVEFMDAKGWDDPLHLQNLARTLRHKYSPTSHHSISLAAILCMDDHAYAFALAHRDDLFPRIPLVFGGLNDFRPEALPGKKNVTGVAAEYHFAGTLETILKLHPGTKRFLVVGDQTRSGRSALTRLERVVPQYERRAEFEYITDATHDELKEALTTTPAGSVVLYLSFLRDRNGRHLTLEEGRRFVSDSTSAPVYCFWDFFGGTGLVGGRGLSAYSQGQSAALLVLRILNGERAGDIPIERNPPNPYMFDWQQMTRFHLAEDSLPAGSIIIGKPDSFMERYGVWLWGMVIFFLLEAALIAGVVIARAQKRSLEERLRKAQRLEAVGRLAGGIAHDFKNQLTVIAGYCESLDKRLPENSVEAKYLHQVRRAAQRSTTLTDQLLSFSRRQTLRPRVLNLNRILQELHDAMARMIGEDVRLQFQVGEEVPNVELDRAQLERALLNLATNARDAMPGGGDMVVRTFTARSGELGFRQVSDLPVGTYAALQMVDSGTGMPPDIQRRAFEPFFTTKEVGKGTGLGLSMVYGFVRQSGGTVEAESVEGRGTTVTLYFPAVDREEEVTERELPHVPERLGDKTILVLEDDDAVRELVCETLSQAGYRVLSADSGGRALALFEEESKGIALLITDVIMPGLSGPQVAHQMQDKSPGLLVLYMSGYSRESFSANSLLPPEANLLGKPFTGDELLGVVATTLDRVENRTI